MKNNWIEYGLKTTDSGVYMIKNINNGKVYVGSATRLIQRLSNHFYSLKNNRHHSIHLQNAWNLDKYYFVCGVIEFVNDKNQLKIIEQKYIDKYNSANDKFGYNICPFARNNLGCKQTRGIKERSEKMKGCGNHFFGKHHTSESLKNISENNVKKKLNINDIVEIKNLWNCGFNQPTIAKMFNVRQPHISKIVNNKKRVKIY